MSIKFARPTVKGGIVLTIAVGASLVGTVLAGAISAMRHSTAPLATQQSLRIARGPAQIVRFTVYDVGIFPSEVRASPGLVALHLDDMAGDTAGLVVMSESFQIVGQVVRRPGRGRESARLTLIPGRYSIYDASRPTHRATLIIAP